MTSGSRISKHGELRNVTEFQDRGGVSALNPRMRKLILGTAGVRVLFDYAYYGKRVAVVAAEPIASGSELKTAWSRAAARRPPFRRL
jgi:hypothetical protein